MSTHQILKYLISSVASLAQLASLSVALPAELVSPSIGEKAGETSARFVLSELD